MSGDNFSKYEKKKKYCHSFVLIVGSFNDNHFYFCYKEKKSESNNADFIYYGLKKEQPSWGTRKIFSLKFEVDVMSQANHQAFPVPPPPLFLFLTFSSISIMIISLEFGLKLSDNLNYSSK